jgi:hypothetical protein
MSSSRTIDGGLTFFPHSGVCDSRAGGSSTNAGGADTIAVAESMDAGIGAPVSTAAPTGRRGVAVLAFWAGGRRTGANARAADQPLDGGRIRMRTREFQ